jgi:hypothetical protein
MGVVVGIIVASLAFMTVRRKPLSQPPSI